MIRDVRTYDDEDGRLVVMRMDADTGAVISYTGRVVLQREDHLPDGQIVFQPIPKTFSIKALGIKDAFKKFDAGVAEVLEKLKQETSGPKIIAAAAGVVDKLDRELVNLGGGR